MGCFTHNDLVAKQSPDDQDVDLLQLPNAVSALQIQAAIDSVDSFHDFKREHIPFLNHIFLSFFDITYPIHVNTFSIDWERDFETHHYCSNCLEDEDQMSDTRETYDFTTGKLTITGSCEKYSADDLLNFLQNPGSYCTICEGTLIMTAGNSNCAFCNKLDQEQEKEWHYFQNALTLFLDHIVDYITSFFPSSLFYEQTVPSIL